LERVATFLLEMDRRLAFAGMIALPMCRRRHRRLSRPDAGNRLARAVGAAERRRGRVFQRPPDRAAQARPAARDGSIGSDLGRRQECSATPVPGHWLLVSASVLLRDRLAASTPDRLRRDITYLAKMCSADLAYRPAYPMSSPSLCIMFVIQRGTHG
jgi:hypothetical protein